MKKSLIFIFIFLFSCTSNSKIIDCKFDSMNKNIKSLISKYEPITSCKEGFDNDGNTAFYKVKNNEFEVSIVPANNQIIKLDEQKGFNNEKVSLTDFFNSIYVKGIPPVNQYAKDQKDSIGKETPYGVIEISNGTAYFQFDASFGPYVNSASIVFNDKENKYWDISSKNKDSIIFLLLGVKK